MKYLGITNEDNMEIVREFLEKNNISFYEFSSPEERMLTESVCNILDNELPKYGLSSEDLSVELESSIIDKSVEEVLNDSQAFQELDEYILETVRETIEEEIDFGILSDWTEETGLNNSILLKVCNIIREFYETPDIDILECFEKFQNCCSIWNSSKEFYEYMSEGSGDVVESIEELNNFFEIESGVYLACM